MLLRRITKHVTDQNWFAVFLDFFIVVVGILIAFQITNWSEAKTQRANLVAAETALKPDIIVNFRNAKERLALTQCRIESIRALSEALLLPDPLWQGMPREDLSFDDDITFPYVLRAPSRTWGRRIWNAELDRGSFNLMDIDRRQTLDFIFQLAKGVEDLQNENYTAQSRLKILANTMELSRRERARYFEMLTEIDQASFSIELDSKYIIDSVLSLEVEFNAEEREAMAKDIEEQNVVSRELYGDCWVDIVFDFLNETTQVK